MILRNIVKVLPWQFGHMAAVRLASGEVSGAAIVFDTLSVGLLVLIAGPPLVGHRGMHDKIAGTTVLADPAAG